MLKIVVMVNRISKIYDIVVKIRKKKYKELNYIVMIKIIYIIMYNVERRRGNDKELISFRL